RIAQSRIAAAQGGLEQANAALWPRLQLQSGYTRSDQPVTVFGYALNQRSYGSSLDFNDVPDGDNLNVRGLVTVPIYNGGRTKAGREAARAGTEAALQNAGAVRNTLAFEVARTFYSVLKTREFIRATGASVRSFEDSLIIASNRHHGGTILKAELLDVDVRLAQAREDFVRARNANALAERALRNLIGIEGGEFTVADSAPAAGVPEAGGGVERPELAALREEQRAAEAGVRRARGGYLPRVDAFGSLDYDRGWRFDADGKSYTVGVMAQWSLWDGRLTRGEVRQAQASLEATQEEQRKLRLDLDFEVEQARLNLNAATERLTVTEKAVAQAAESVELTRARFEQGLAIATQLIDAETAFTAARVRRADSEADERIAIAALRKALGLPQLPTP
ncbi:MAG TPA: TolC family protein, partial [Arenibaculum sp.]|nr:TolC family protein [Arenibaculum sp.]